MGSWVRERALGPAGRWDRVLSGRRGEGRRGRRHRGLCGGQRWPVDSEECIAVGAGLLWGEQRAAWGWSWRGHGVPVRKRHEMRVHRVRAGRGGDGVQRSPHQSMLRNSAGEMWGPGAGLQWGGQSPPFPLPPPPRGVSPSPEQGKRR